MKQGTAKDNVIAPVTMHWWSQWCYQGYAYSIRNFIIRLIHIQFVIHVYNLSYNYHDYKDRDSHVQAGASLLADLSKQWHTVPIAGDPSPKQIIRANVVHF